MPCLSACSFSLPLSTMNQQAQLAAVYGATLQVLESFRVHVTLQTRTSIAMARSARNNQSHTRWHTVGHNPPGLAGCLGRQSLQACPATASATSCRVIDSQENSERRGRESPVQSEMPS